MWRYPTVSVHGIEGAFSDPGTKTVIPAKVTAKFSIRQVPNMDPAMVKKQVKQDVNALLSKIAALCALCAQLPVFLLCYFDPLGNRLPSLCVCQEEES